MNILGLAKYLELFKEFVYPALSECDYVAMTENMAKNLYSALSKLTSGIPPMSRLQQGTLTAFAVSGHTIKLIIKNLMEQGRLTRENLNNFAEQGLAFVKELANVPFGLTHALSSFLMGKEDLDEEETVAMITRREFKDKFFKFSADKMELVDDFVESFHAKLNETIAANAKFASRLEEDKNKPIFGCPARYARIKAPVSEGSVDEEAVIEYKNMNYVEAAYRLLLNHVQKGLSYVFEMQEAGELVA